MHIKLTAFWNQSELIHWSVPGGAHFLYLLLYQKHTRTHLVYLTPGSLHPQCSLKTLFLRYILSRTKKFREGDWGIHVYKRMWWGGHSFEMRSFVVVGWSLVPVQVLLVMTFEGGGWGREWLAPVRCSVVGCMPVWLVVCYVLYLFHMSYAVANYVCRNAALLCCPSNSWDVQCIILTCVMVETWGKWVKLHMPKLEKVVVRYEFS